MFLIRRFNLLITAIANLIQTGLALFYAIQDNTAALTANAEVLKSILLEAAQTEKAVTYLAAVERHRQVSAGQPAVFPEVIQ